ncbi:sodium:proton antiporter NhaD [Marinobacter zhejiangensis]|uniref:Sodium/proton antiporter, NhaD family (TC 2.A.62) n=1 Tax=Marinobacter zhejiangensis TaxID=488535 RepID=A0A1I4NHN8_9GAMM|nr:sodium:proton antiporter NhaD [Marinobacter zhejiangensis]SFM14971.1 sodium/proton antiporter, NhaD family (TC 2.A.62) [Marinobacter zhejiangensis]
MGLLMLLAGTAVQASQAGAQGMTSHPIGYLAIGVFVLAYIFVMLEEKLHMRKSKPVLLAAGIIWFLVAGLAAANGDSESANEALGHNLLEYSELLLFLLVAMTYINAMEERQLFDALRAWLVSKGFSYTGLFWITGILAFFISPVADNLTTALLMCAVLLKVGENSPRFIGLGCVNIVVAANAGGAFSPFGDITTLMVWQKGVVNFSEFFVLFVPSLVNFLVPAAIMHFFIPKEPPKQAEEKVIMKRGARRTLALFLLTIATAVLGHNFLHLPAVVGMMMGLGYLQVLGYYLRLSFERSVKKERAVAIRDKNERLLARLDNAIPFDVFSPIARAEWDTLLFFYGVVLCVGGLGFLGYLSEVSTLLYTNWNQTAANVTVGLLSAVVDNIPVMFAVLSMEPDMSHGQWLLVTLTAGVGGSMLSIGSAAGVALMGQARGHYTMMTHLRWTPVILLGYGASIVTHLWLNAELF